MTCSHWQKLHLGSRARRWPLNVWLRFCFDLLCENEASPCGSSTWHWWARKSNSCLSDGSSLPVKEVRHSYNMSESSLEVRRGTRRSFQCIVGCFNAWRKKCKCFVALSESLLRSIVFSLVMVGKSNMALTWVWTITRLLSYRSLRIARDIVISVRQF